MLAISCGVEVDASPEPMPCTPTAPAPTAGHGTAAAGAAAPVSVAGVTVGGIALRGQTSAAITYAATAATAVTIGAMTATFGRRRRRRGAAMRSTSPTGASVTGAEPMVSSRPRVRAATCAGETQVSASMCGSSTMTGTMLGTASPSRGTVGSAVASGASGPSRRIGMSPVSAVATSISPVEPCWRRARREPGGGVEVIPRK
ncbi:hypothetical protein ASG00_04670 [Microbacterium sp. Leaf351]|nr:hypothetical protein ASG00_04670 [Microbacterium sp. Leaf351]